MVEYNIINKLGIFCGHITISHTLMTFLNNYVSVHMCQCVAINKVILILDKDCVLGWQKWYGSCLALGTHGSEPECVWLLGSVSPISSRCSKQGYIMILRNVPWNVATKNITGANTFIITSCFQQCLLWAHIYLL